MAKKLGFLTVLAAVMVLTMGQSTIKNNRQPATLTVNTTQGCTIADTNERDLWTYNLPANTLGTANRGVRIQAWGVTANNANNKTWKVYFGGTNIAALSTTAALSGVRSESLVIRTGAATQIANGDVEIALGTQNNTLASPTATLSSPVVIKVTGQNGAASANDLCFTAAIVELF